MPSVTSSSTQKPITAVQCHLLITAAQAVDFSRLATGIELLYRGRAAWAPTKTYRHITPIFPDLSHKGFAKMLLRSNRGPLI